MGLKHLAARIAVLLVRQIAVVEPEFLVGQGLDPHAPGHGLPARQSQRDAAQQVEDRKRPSRHVLLVALVRQVGQRIDQQRIEPVGRLRPHELAERQFLGVRRQLAVDMRQEETPVDAPLAGQRPEAVEAADAAATERHVEDRQSLELPGFLVRNCATQRIARPDHRMAEAIGRNRELDRHERISRRLRLVILQVRLAVVVYGLEHGIADHAPHEIVHHHPLIVPAHDALCGVEGAEAGDAVARVALLGRRLGEIDHDLVVKALPKRVNLHDDVILVVALVADHGARTILIGRLHLAAEIELRSLHVEALLSGVLQILGRLIRPELDRQIGIVEVGLIGRPAAVHGIRDRAVRSENPRLRPDHCRDRDRRPDRR